MPGCESLYNLEGGGGADSPLWISTSLNPDDSIAILAKT